MCESVHNYNDMLRVVRGDNSLVLYPSGKLFTIKIQVPQLPFNIACNIIQSCRIVLYRQTKHTHTHIINSNCACMQFALIFDTVQHVIRPQAVMSIVPSSHCNKTALYLRSKQDLSTKSLVRRAAECTLDKHAGHWTNR